jgi:peptidoglycan hydrolase CwlO-like protein
MLRKLIIVEIIAAVLLGIYAYKVSETYQSVFDDNQASKSTLDELTVEKEKTQDEYEQLNEELVSLRDSIDTKILEIWKRRVQDLQKELE